MNSLHKTDRKWEIWGKQQAEALASEWCNPSELQHDSSLGGEDIHWNLTKKVYSLIEGESVLDVGCGMGHLFMLAKDRFEYLGIDTSKAMLEKAREFFPKDEDKFQLGDAYDLSMLPNFDTVVATGVLLHLPDSQPVIEQLWSKARICTIFATWVGETPLTETTKVSFKGLIQTLRTTKQHVLKRLILQRGPKELVWWTLKRLVLRREPKELIQRRETIQHLSEIFEKLENLDRIEEFPFSHPVSEVSNYIFKLWKKRL